MDAKLMQTIIDGNAAVTISMNAADLRSVIMEMAHQERQRIKEELEASREKPTLSRAEAAKALSVHVHTLDRWTAMGYLNPVRLGSKVLYKAGDIDRMLARAGGNI